jgi:hypothetical protein
VVSGNLNAVRRACAAAGNHETFFVMAEKFIIAADRAHLRIYRYSQAPGQFTPSIQPVNALDLGEGRQTYSDSDTDFAGRYPGIRNRAGGLSTDERLPLQEGMERRAADELAAQIAAFMEKRPNSTWDLAAPASLRNDLVDALPDTVRRRLDQVVSKDLVNVPPAELRAQFAL